MHGCLITGALLVVTGPLLLYEHNSVGLVSCSAWYVGLATCRRWDRGSLTLLGWQVSDHCTAGFMRT